MNSSRLSSRSLSSKGRPRQLSRSVATVPIMEPLSSSKAGTGAQEDARREEATVLRESGRRGPGPLYPVKRREPLSPVKEVIGGEIRQISGGKVVKAVCVASLNKGLSAAVARVVEKRADRPLEVVAQQLLHGPPVTEVKEDTAEAYAAHLKQPLEAALAESGGSAHTMGRLLLEAAAQQRASTWKDLDRKALALKLKALKIEQAVRDREVKELQAELQSRPVEKKCKFPEEAEIQKKYNEIAQLRVQIQKRNNCKQPASDGRIS